MPTPNEIAKRLAGWGAGREEIIAAVREDTGTTEVDAARVADLELAEYLDSFAMPRRMGARTV